jgi:hypothetical protein
MTEPRWITIDAVMTLLNVTNTNARQLACRRQWRRITLRGRTHYLFTDVLDMPHRRKS